MSSNTYSSNASTHDFRPGAISIGVNDCFGDLGICSLALRRVFWRPEKVHCERTTVESQQFRYVSTYITRVGLGKDAPVGQSHHRYDIHESATGQRVATLQEKSTSIFMPHFSPDDKKIAASVVRIKREITGFGRKKIRDHRQQALVVWNVATGQVAWESMDFEILNSSGFAPDSNHVVSTSWKRVNPAFVMSEHCRLP